MPNPENLKEPWKEGDPSPNPSGRPKGSRNLSTILRDMLETDVDEDGKKIKFSDAIIQKLLKKANSGDVRAIQEVFDRTEGKAKQEIDLNGQLTNYNVTPTPEEARKIKESLDKSI